MKRIRKIGVIIEVNGDVSAVGMYDNTNDSSYIWDGDVLFGPKIGSYLTINQNNVKIISKVNSEKILDSNNSINSDVFDNSYSKNSIKRIVTLKTIGAIEDKKFILTNKYMPMIGNQVSITTKEELNIIYSTEDENVIEIGTSLLEEYPIKLPIDKIFPSHIGIFGNTGSGKSNTLHKLYLELFRSGYSNKIKDYSQFFLIDFNGEYCAKNQFGIDDTNKKIFKINTSKANGDNKLPILESSFFDPDILSSLFDARAATQVPFLKQSIEKFNEIKENANKFSNVEIGLLKKLIRDSKNVTKESINEWTEVAKDLGVSDETLSNLNELSLYVKYNNAEAKIPGTDIYIISNDQITKEGENWLKINEINKELVAKYDKQSLIKKLKYFLDFQGVYATAWKKFNSEHINPLFKRIDVAVNSLEKVIELKNEIDQEYVEFNIISLAKANSDTKRLLPMLLSKMIYNRQKQITIDNNGVKNTVHLIIDEAHNILCSSTKNIGDEWQDYRLSIFEEIIKEGRKFGFYLTLASQRPADISPTIMSQLHNYFIHRLINENDINMLKNTMSSLDNISFQKLPSLGQGEIIITGSSINIPILAKVKKEEELRPQSDDVKLTSLWNS